MANEVHRPPYGEGDKPLQIERRTTIESGGCCLGTIYGNTVDTLAYVVVRSDGLMVDADTVVDTFGRNDFRLVDGLDHATVYENIEDAEKTKADFLKRYPPIQEHRIAVVRISTWSRIV